MSGAIQATIKITAYEPNYSLQALRIVLSAVNAELFVIEDEYDVDVPYPQRLHVVTDCGQADVEITELNKGA